MHADTFTRARAVARRSSRCPAIAAYSALTARCHVPRCKPGSAVHEHAPAAASAIGTANSGIGRLALIAHHDRHCAGVRSAKVWQRASPVCGRRSRRHARSKACPFDHAAANSLIVGRRFLKAGSHSKRKVWKAGNAPNKFIRLSRSHRFNILRLWYNSRLELV